MGLWLANPVEQRLLVIMEALFEDLGIRDRICWIVSQNTDCSKISAGCTHTWDKEVAKWRGKAGADLRANGGAIPKRVFGMGLGQGIAETRRYLQSQGRHDRFLDGDILVGVYTYLNGLKRLFSKGKIDGAFIWNQWGYENRILADLCRTYKKPCWYLEQGFLPKTLCFSRIGLYDEAHDGSSWAHEPEDDLPDQVIAEGLAGYKGSSVIEGTSEATENELAELTAMGHPLVLVAGQLDGDSNIIFRSPECPQNRDLLFAVCKTPGVRVLYKPHPYDNSAFAKDPDIPGGCMISSTLELASPKVKLHQLIELCDVLVTRNSTSGIEAIVYDKPVIHTGRAIYNVGSLSMYTPLSGMAAAVQLMVDKPLPARVGWEGEKLRFFRWLVRRHLYFHEDPAHPPAFRNASVKRVVEEFNAQCNT